MLWSARVDEPGKQILLVVVLRRAADAEIEACRKRLADSEAGQDDSYSG